PVHDAQMSVISTVRKMQRAPVVPHREHVGLPAMAIHELVTSHMIVNKAKQCRRFLLCHALDTDRVDWTDKEGLAACDGMGTNERMRTSLLRFLADNDFHCPGFFFLSEDTFGAVRQRGAVYCDKPLQQTFHDWRHRLRCTCAIRIVRVPTDGRINFGGNDRCGLRRLLYA